MGDIDEPQRTLARYPGVTGGLNILNAIQREFGIPGGREIQVDWLDNIILTIRECNITFIVAMGAREGPTSNVTKFRDCEYHSKNLNKGQ